MMHTYVLAKRSALTAPVALGLTTFTTECSNISILRRCSCSKYKIRLGSFPWEWEQATVAQATVAQATVAHILTRKEMSAQRNSSDALDLLWCLDFKFFLFFLARKTEIASILNEAFNVLHNTHYAFTIFGNKFTIICDFFLLLSYKLAMDWQCINVVLFLLLLRKYYSIS
jgi:hypothetical protein